MEENVSGCFFLNTLNLLVTLQNMAQGILTLTHTILARGLKAELYSIQHSFTHIRNSCACVMTDELIT